MYIVLCTLLALVNYLPLYIVHRPLVHYIELSVADELTGLVICHWGMVYCGSDISSDVGEVDS